MKVLSVFFAMCFSLNAATASAVTGSSATVNSVTSAEIAAFAKSYPQGGTFKSFLTQYQKDMPEALHQYFAYKFQKIENKELPHVKMIGPDSLDIESKTVHVTLTFLPDHKLKLNGKILDLPAAGNFEEQWNQTMKALPKHDQASLMRLFINEAHADNLESINGGLMMATGAMTTATSAVGIIAEGASAALIGATGAGLIVMAASYIFWNNGVCTDLGKEKFRCARQKDELEERLKKQPTALASMKAHQKPRCEGVDQAPFKEASDVINELIGANKEIFRAVVTCQSLRREVVKCIEESSLMLYHMCAKMYGVTDAFLPAYAKASAGGAPKSTGQKATK
jgi:hypothetical protein